MVCLHKIINSEVVLAVIQPRAAPNDLLELDHRIHGPHEHDIAHIARVHPSGELLRCGQDGGDGFFVVLKLAQPLLAQSAVLRGHPLAIVGVGAGLALVYQVAHHQRMLLRGAKHNGLVALVNGGHEDVHPLFLTRLDLYEAVEVFLFIPLARFNFAFH